MTQGTPSRLRATAWEVVSFFLGLGFLIAMIAYASYELGGLGAGVAAGAAAGAWQTAGIAGVWYGRAKPLAD